MSLQNTASVKTLVGHEQFKKLLVEAAEALEETRKRFQARRNYETSLISQTFVEANWRHSLDGNFACYIRIYPLDKYRSQESESENRCYDLLRQAKISCEASEIRNQDLFETFQILQCQAAQLRETRTKSPILEVFPEILIKIISASNLTITELGNLRLVCRPFRQLMQTQSLWREVRSNPSEHLSIHLASKMSGYTLTLLAINLIALDDDQSKKIFQTALDFVENLPNLRGLSFVDLPPGRDIPIEETSDPIPIRIKSRSLRRFKYKSNFQPLIFDDGFLSILTNIEHLSISYGSSSALFRPSNPTLNWLSRFLEVSSSNLEALCLPVISEESEGELIRPESGPQQQEIIDFPKLKTITLRAPASTWARFEDVLGRMNFSNLRDLDLHSPPRILKFFRSSALSKLTLKNTCGLEDSPSLGLFISTLENLVELNLDQESQTASSLDEMFDFLTPKPLQAIPCNQLKVVRIYNQEGFKALSVPAFLVSRVLASQCETQEEWQEKLQESHSLLKSHSDLSILSTKLVKAVLSQMKKLVVREGERGSLERRKEDSGNRNRGQVSEIIERFEMMDCDDVGKLKKWIGDLVINCRYINSK